MADDYYRVLGVPRTATAEEIQRAYRTLARRSHPDVNKEPGAEDRFKQITEAYHVLSDPKSRANYDRFGAQWRQVPEDFDARRHAGASTGPRRTTSFVNIDLEDLLGGVFGGGRGGPVQGADAEAEITIGVEDSYLGGQRTVTLPGGDHYKLTIPRGVTEGQRIRIAGEGSTGLGGGPRGDLYLVVHFRPDRRFTVSGRDVTARLPVAPWEAALGARVPLTTPGGEVQVKVPAGSSSGRRLRLRGQGLPDPHGDPGDLYAEVRILVPPHPSADEQRLLEELARVSSFDPRSSDSRSSK
ncbi:J domain-containing protein [Dactylosporangium salmoneum]|uniref:DnaJ C-terminal domain-containing protein n=1 Tax=Dactylosporangium salmoneum TaxID=53361 RepID=A0ABN3GDN3_9ACTN